MSQEEIDIIRERMKTFEQDRKGARPADEVMERLLRVIPLLEPARQTNASR